MAGNNTVRAAGDIMSEFETEGYVILENAFSEDFSRLGVAAMRGLPELVRKDIGESTFRAARNRGELELRVPFLYDDFFLSLIEHPFVTNTLDRFFPPPAILRFQNVAYHEPEHLRDDRFRTNAHFHWNYPKRLGPRFILDLVAVFDKSAEEGFEIMPRSQHSDICPAASHARALCLPQSSLTVLNPYLWHRECDNADEQPRMYVHLQFARPFIKPHFDYVRMLGAERIRALSPRLQQMLGWNARVPGSLQEFYAAPNERFYNNPISGSAHAARIDVVIPVYHSRETLNALIQQIGNSTASISAHCTMHFVDDCGDDGSKELLKAAGEVNPAVRLIEQPRNFGQHAAIAQGLRASTADIVIVMDADLQHQPKDIPQFVELVMQGFDIVIGRAKSKHTGQLRSAINGCWYGLLSLLGAPKERESLVCYSALSRRAVAAYLGSHGCDKLYLGVLLRLRLPTAFCEIESVPRPSGKSSYTWSKLFRLAGSVLRYRLSSKA